MKRRILFSIVAFICCLLLAIDIIHSAYINNRMNQQFEYTETSGLTAQYRDKVPLQEMNLDVYLNFIVVAVSTEIEKTVKLPVTLTYYEESAGSREKVFTIEKGTEVYIYDREEELQRQSYGYGLCGFPDYEANWCYVRPFDIVGDESAVDKEDYYFINKSDLIKVAEEFVRNNEYYMASGKKDDRTEAEGLVLALDQYLYDQHFFFSPDLQNKIWTGVDSAALAAAVMFTAMAAMKKRS